MMLFKDQMRVPLGRICHQAISRKKTETMWLKSHGRNIFRNEAPLQKLTTSGFTSGCKIGLYCAPHKCNGLYDVSRHLLCKAEHNMVSTVLKPDSDMLLHRTVVSRNMSTDTRRSEVVAAIKSESGASVRDPNFPNEMPSVSNLEKMVLVEDTPNIYVEEIEEMKRRNISENQRYLRLLVSVIIAGGVISYLNYATWDVSSGIFRNMDGLLEKLFLICPNAILDPEVSHHAAVWLAAHGIWPLDLDRDDTALSVNVKGLHFPSPIGLAAGFDKHGEAVLPLMKMGFSFVEVGTVTPLPQPGNPRPRMFRLAEDRAIINRCGFNSEGLDAVEPRIQTTSNERWTDRMTRRNLMGINIGKNKDTLDAASDVRAGIRRLGRYGDYIVINLSSPNTKGLRDFQQKDALAKIIDAAREEIDTLEKLSIQKARASAEHPIEVFQKGEDFFPTQTGRRPLLFVKIAPDLTDEEKKDIAEVALEKGLDGLIVTNTTIERPESLRSVHKNEIGGLSGRPLKNISTACVSDFYKLTKGKVIIIASGGVETGWDAMEKIKAGASLVQVYSSLIYRGPAVARRVKDELFQEMNREGIQTIDSAIGMNHRTHIDKKIRPPQFT